jgi:hypothetical protein
MWTHCYLSRLIWVEFPLMVGSHWNSSLSNGPISIMSSGRAAQLLASHVSNALSTSVHEAKLNVNLSSQLDTRQTMAVLSLIGKPHAGEGCFNLFSCMGWVGFCNKRVYGGNIKLKMRYGVKFRIKPWSSKQDKSHAFMNVCNTPCYGNPNQVT